MNNHVVTQEVPSLFRSLFDDARYDAIAREQAIARHVEEMIDLDAERGRSFPSDAERRRYIHAFRDFQAWAHDCGVPSLPAAGHTAAMYLLDMIANREHLGEIECAGDAIMFTHDMAEHYLDRTPIKAALRFAADRSIAA